MLIQSNWIESIDSYLDNVIDRCRGAMEQLANQSQDMVFELLNAKVVDLLGSMCFVNWVPSVLPSGPHEFVEEVVDYLRVTFMCLSHLPQTVREAAHFTCCSRINREIILFLLSPKVPHLNLLSVKALVLDFSALEKYADSCGISQLRECFSEGKALVNAMIHHDLPSFGDDPPILRKANFPQLDVLKLALLVEKLLPLPPGAQTYGGMPVYDKKNLAIISKSLKHAKY
ncbi:SEC15A [Symbiodinium microadriaticum]|nr:SEC15A [Symbiodinium microadriaticum]